MLGLRNGLPGARRWRQVWSDASLKHLEPTSVASRADAAARAVGFDADANVDAGITDRSSCAAVA
jgi:tRNA-dihydrouridine synthase A